MSPKSDGAAAIAVARQIRVVRGQRVLLDEDLAAIYGVTTSALNQAMRRNRGRFPPDFVLELTSSEWESLRSQIVILKTGRGRHRKFRPVAFTTRRQTRCAGEIRGDNGRGYPPAVQRASG